MNINDTFTIMTPLLSIWWLSLFFLFFSLSDIDLLEEEKGTFLITRMHMYGKMWSFWCAFNPSSLESQRQPMWGTLESNPGACQCLDQRRCWEINLAYALMVGKSGSAAGHSSRHKNMRPLHKRPTARIRTSQEPSCTTYLATNATHGKSV